MVVVEFGETLNHHITTPLVGTQIRKVDGLHTDQLPNSTARETSLFVSNGIITNARTFSLFHDTSLATVPDAFFL